MVGGPKFFKNDAGDDVAVNGDRNCAMANDYFMNETKDRKLSDI